jgi:hypothetical protein
VQVAELVLQLVPFACKERLEIGEIPSRNVESLNRLAVGDQKEIALGPQTVAFSLVMGIQDFLPLFKAVFLLGLD